MDFALFQIYDEQRLLALDFGWISAFLFEARYDRSFVVAEVHNEPDELLRVLYVLNGLDQPNPDVHSLQIGSGNLILYRRGYHINQVTDELGTSRTVRYAGWSTESRAR